MEANIEARDAQTGALIRYYPGQVEAITLEGEASGVRVVFDDIEGADSYHVTVILSPRAGAWVSVSEGARLRAPVLAERDPRKPKGLGSGRGESTPWTQPV